MSRSSPRARYRREFLRFVAASPLLAYGLREAWAQEAAAPLAKDVLSVLDFEALARPKLPPAHWGYMASGSDDNLTLQANAAAYKNIQLRPRRLVDVSKIDTSVELFGQRFASPIFVCPVGGLRMFHADGEVATARAARAKNALQVLSTMTSTGVEEVMAARADGLWYQLVHAGGVGRHGEAGAPCRGGGLSRAGVDHRPPGRAEHGDGHAPPAHRHASMRHVPRDGDRRATQHRDVQRLEQPALQPVQRDVGLGGALEEDDVDEDRHQRASRPERTPGSRANTGPTASSCPTTVAALPRRLRSTIDAVPEVVDAVSSQIPVLVDGGVRRGSDAFKALAYGARAVGIGRPYTWGLAAFGQEGVERVLDILNAELTMTMRQCGTPTLARITKAHVARI